MSECPVVSVVLTSYNKANFIKRSIESVIQQTYEKFELLIVDDGSVDESRTIINRYAKLDSRVRACFFDKNLGIPSAHNKGIDMARGKYIAMIDCDDFWNEDKLEKQIALLEANEEYGACFSWIKVIDELEQEVPSEKCEQRDLMWNSKNHSQGEWLRLFFTEGCKLGNPSMVVRKSVLDEVGRYSYGLRQLQDYDLFIRILKKYNVYIIQEKLVNYRWLTGNIKNTSYDNRENANRTNIEYYLVCKTFFENLNKNLFKEGFSKMITDRGDTQETQLLYDQAFLLKDKYLSPIAGKLAALDKMYLLLNDMADNKKNKNRYGMTSAEFAEELKSALLYDDKYYMPVDNQAYILKLQEDLGRTEREWYKCRNYVDELEERLRRESNLIREYQKNEADSRKYIGELENKEKNSSQIIKEYLYEIKKAKDYISELEKKARESSGLIGQLNEENSKQKKYIQELEEKSREASKIIKELKSINNLE